MYCELDQKDRICLLFFLPHNCTSFCEVVFPNQGNRSSDNFLNVCDEDENDLVDAMRVHFGV